MTLACPVYNEAENVPALLQRLAADVSVPFELVVVYDRDDDNTLPALAQHGPQAPFPIRCVKNHYGRGALNAVKTGLEVANGTAVAVIMADLADDLRTVAPMYTLLEDGGYDLVVGSRYMRGGKQIGGPLLKGLLSRLAGWSFRLLTGIPTCDITNNFKMYRTSFVHAVTIESEAGFEIAMELTVKAYAGGYRIVEVPSVWTDRVAGTSRFQLWRWIPHYLRWYRYGLTHRPGRRIRAGAKEA
ncbi:MAG TPA: glycosyltransferase [Candidatus Acidoferrales bacterium]|nr:glycosyltransferase [Candidatus Acidoferrales bacterium]